MKYSEACKTLEIEKQTAPKAAKAAYRRLVQQHHPDKGGDAEKFMAVVRAYKGYLARYPFAHATQRHQAAAQKDKPRKRQGLLLARRKGRIGLNGLCRMIRRWRK
ncbi:MAG: DnaJ domain-containing protein [Candidatus Zeuxoniibacter abyssi]|nr:MAG: DnaJ domain-containing protein [Candidatus Persebacteraceae bacterium AB1(2)]